LKKFIASLVEGVIVGLFIAIILNILDIEVTSNQLIIISVGVLLVTSIASAISRFIAKGESPIRHEWVFNYGENRIEVTAGLTEKLYINDELVDQKKGISLSRVELGGQLKTGEKVRAAIIGGMTAKCEVYVGNEQLQIVATKTP